MSVITGRAPRGEPGPLVEIGSFVARVGVGVTTAVFCDGDGEGDGEGEGETTGDGEGEGSVSTGPGAATGATVFEVCGAAEVFGAC